MMRPQFGMFSRFPLSKENVQVDGVLHLWRRTLGWWCGVYPPPQAFLSSLIHFSLYFVPESATFPGMLFHPLKCLLLLSSSATISQWQGEPKERVISLVLAHLPLLKPGNTEARGEYMRLLPRILAHTIEHGHHLEESRQLLSYALIHPATSLEDRAALALWLNHLEERAAARGDSLERPPPAGPHHHHHQSTPPSTLPSSSSSTNNSSSGHPFCSHPHQRYGSDDRLNGWQSSRESGVVGGWQQQGCENGHLLLYPSSSVPATINTVGTGGGSNTRKENVTF